MFTPASQHSTLATGSASGQATPSPSPSPTPTPKICARNAPGFPCTMRNRIKKIRGYMRRLPGSIGIVIYNRNNGATWHNANADVAYPAASTMKLAMMTDILLRNNAGSLTLSNADRQAMFQALYTSNDDDANYLWDKYEDASFLNRIRAFGMNDARFTSSYINWGFMDCTAQDLDNLINYVLKDTPASVRNYLVYRLQHVAALDQQWGVWGARPGEPPGQQGRLGAGRQHLDHQHRRVRRAGPAVHDGDHVQPGGFRRGRGRRVQVRLQQADPDRVDPVPGPPHHGSDPAGLRGPVTGASYPRRMGHGVSKAGAAVQGPPPPGPSGGRGPLPGQFRDVTGIATAAIHLGAGDHEECSSAVSRVRVVRAVRRAVHVQDRVPWQCSRSPWHPAHVSMITADSGITAPSESALSPPADTRSPPGRRGGDS